MFNFLYSSSHIRHLLGTAILVLAVQANAQVNDRQDKPAGTATGTKQTWHCCGTKMPYRAEQNPGSYESPPAGFKIIHTQMVTRHGSRGLTKPGEELALYKMWLQAQKENALTPLGKQFGNDLYALIRAQAFLGEGSAAVKKPGYGNLSELGINELRDIAQRMVKRNPQLFAEIASGAKSGGQTPIVYSFSGVDRAEQSAEAYLAALRQVVPGLSPFITPSAPLTAYPENDPKPQRAGVDRFDLYFHKLNEKTDLATDMNDPRTRVYRHSLAYQDYLDSPQLKDRLTRLRQDPKLKATSKTVLSRLFRQDFLQKVDSGEYRFDGDLELVLASPSGDATKTIQGGKKIHIASLVDASMALYDIAIIAPLLRHEAKLNFHPYLARKHLLVFDEAADAESFYQKGPGFADIRPGVTYNMAEGLLEDFFLEADPTAADKTSAAAKLRFSHAEAIFPLVSLLGIPPHFTPVDSQGEYSWSSNPWRSHQVARMTANVQWDAYRDTNGRILIRMLHNEREVRFKPACDHARWKPDSYYYELNQLRTCYGKAR